LKPAPAEIASHWLLFINLIHGRFCACGAVISMPRLIRWGRCVVRDMPPPTL